MIRFNRAHLTGDITFRGTLMSASEPLPPSELVRRFRLTAGVSQEELAGRSGWSTRQTSGLEPGHRKFPAFKQSATWRMSPTQGVDNIPASIGAAAIDRYAVKMARAA